MGIIMVKAVRRGVYPELDHAGNKIPTLARLRYPESDKHKGPLAGEPFPIHEEDYSPLRKVGVKEIGWMARVDGGPEPILETLAKRGRGRPRKVASAAEADASKEAIPHVRVDQKFDDSKKYAKV